MIGFTLHNVTEGVGIAAPLLPQAKGTDHSQRASPSLRLFLGLALLAGAPAIFGAWIGGFAYSPLAAGLFLGIGVGAIWQVIVEVVRLLIRDSETEDRPLVSWTNVIGFLLGLGIMYATGLLVSA